MFRFFSADITPVFSVKWSPEIIIICWFTQETFVIIKAEKGYAAYFWWNMIYFVCSKEQHLFKIEFL